MNGFVTRFSDREQSPGFMLWNVTNSWQRSIRSALVPFELTHVQFVLLAALSSAQPAQLTQRELAEMAASDVMMTSQVVRVLEKKGLLTRHPHPTDGRAMVLVPTAPGSALINEANAAVEEADDAFFDALGADRTRALADLLASVSRAHQQQ